MYTRPWDFIGMDHVKFWNNGMMGYWVYISPVLILTIPVELGKLGCLIDY